VATVGEICNVADSMMELTGKRNVVTGGAGLLGSFAIDALRARRARRDRAAPASRMRAIEQVSMAMTR
jgi:hypothetical protein